MLNLNSRGCYKAVSKTWFGIYHWYIFTEYLHINTANSKMKFKLALIVIYVHIFSSLY